jgi:hypothetical protein
MARSHLDHNTISKYQLFILSVLAAIVEQRWLKRVLGLASIEI